MKMEAHYIKNIVWGGSGNQGQQIHFRLAFHGSQPEANFTCDLSLVPMLLGNILEYARKADAERVKAQGQTVIAATPYVVTKVNRSGHTLDGKLVSVLVETNQGFPLEIAMTPDQAQQTIDALLREMLRAGKAPRKPGPHGH